MADSRHHTGWDRGVFLLSHSFTVLNLGKGYFKGVGGGEKRECRSTYMSRIHKYCMDDRKIDFSLTVSQSVYPS